MTSRQSNVPALRKRSKRGHPEPYRRSDGRWAVAVDFGRKANGRRFRRHVYARSAEEARARAERVRREEAAGRAEWGPATLLAAWAREWVRRIRPTWSEDGRRKGIKESSWRPYRRHVEQYIAPTLIGQTRLDRLTTRMVREWLEYLGGERGLSARTVTYARTSLNLVIKAAMAEGIIDRNPVALTTVTGETQKEALIFTIEQARRFVRVIRGHPDEALYLISTFAGPRQGEVLPLLRDHLDLEKRFVVFTKTLEWIDGEPVAEGNKNWASRRAVPLTRYVVGVLRRHLEQQEKARLAAGARWVDYGLIFTGEHGQPLRGSTVYRRFQKLLAANDLPRLRFHDLRHSAVSIMLALGLSLHTVQKIVGQSSLEMISVSYTHLTLPTNREV